MSASFSQTYTGGASNSPNYGGTVIFLSYIVAALALTYSIVTRLVRRANTSRVAPRVSLRILFACISFTTLSYYMSAFLFHSHSTWASPRALNLDVWNWMLGSSLFTDFAQELLSNEWATVWTTATLLWTGAVNVWLAVEGRRHRTKGLWQYFAIGQILPISFAQSLFAVELSVSRALEQSELKQSVGQKASEAKAPPEATKPARKAEDGDDQDEAAPDDEHLDLDLGPSLLDGPDAAVITFTSIATMYMIYLLPSYADKPEFMYMVLATRLLLFAPFIVAMRQDEPEDGGMDPMDATFYVAILIIPIALLIYTTVGQVPPEHESLQAAVDGLNTGMATRALGYDLLIGVGSCILMLWGA